MTNNPLSTKHDLPPFSQIKAEHIEPAIKEFLAKNRKSIQAILEDPKNFTWEGLMSPLEQMSEDLQETWGVVQHLSAVVDSKEWRVEHDKALALVTEYSIDLEQNSALYKAILSLRDGSQFKTLNLEQKKVIENYLRDFKLAGIDLDENKKERLKTIRKRISELKNKFEQNILDSIWDWFLLVQDESRLKGLPEHILHQAKAWAEQNQQTGWRLTLEYPCFSAVMAHAEDRDLRKQFYQAYNTLASDQSLQPDHAKWDNGPVMVEQLKLKQALASLLGFESYAEYSLAKKMLKTPKEVLEFLNTLLDPLRKEAEKNLKDTAELQNQNNLF